jgi:putative hydrolase of the HAD superfamily
MFDYGGVISHPLSQQDLALLGRAAGAAVPAFVEEYWQWRQAYDLAELDAAGYWRQVGHGLGREFSDAQVAELVRLDRAACAAVERARRPEPGDQRPAGGRPFRSSYFQL